HLEDGDIELDRGRRQRTFAFATGAPEAPEVTCQDARVNGVVPVLIAEIQLSRKSHRTSGQTEKISIGDSQGSLLGVGLGVAPNVVAERAELIRCHRSPEMTGLLEMIGRVAIAEWICAVLRPEEERVHLVGEWAHQAGVVLVLRAVIVGVVVPIGITEAALDPEVHYPAAVVVYGIGQGSHFLRR